MNKFKQCIYTVILLLTCFVASPFIYKQIWKNSELKKPKEDVKAPVISTQQSNQASQPASEAATTVPQTNENGENVTSPTEAIQPATEAPTVQQTVFAQSGPEYFDDALFIGDSRTVGIRDYGTLKNAQYFCDIGLSAYKIDNSTVNGSTLWDFLNTKKFGKVYLMLGINEVGNDIEYTVSAYRKVVDGIRQAQPDTIVYLLANLHVATYAETAAISNERINALNARISEMADNQKTFYIDVNGVFDDANGALTADFCSDGVHVLAKYYATWCDWLCANTVVQTPAAPASTTAASAAAQPAAETTATTSSRPQNEEFSNQ